MDCEVVFGLQAQNHISTIENMLDEHKSWDEIANEIGWDKDTMITHYVQYLRENQKDE